MEMWKQDNVPKELVAPGQEIKKQFWKCVLVMVAAFEQEVYDTARPENN